MDPTNTSRENSGKHIPGTTPEMQTLIMTIYSGKEPPVIYNRFTYEALLELEKWLKE